jgi:predicted type IV restriction endonuclease
MPHVFLIRGRRLLYSWGIYVLVVLTALLLIVFWRRDGPADSAVRHRRVSGLHALAGGHGDALEAPGQRAPGRML